MATSDRTQFKNIKAGNLGDLRTIANANLVLAQENQRFLELTLQAATAATTDYVLPVCRTDRPMQVKEVRILPGGALTFAAGNFTNVSVGYTNDNGGALTVQAGIDTSNTAANGSTGNWATGVSILVTQNASDNQIVPSGSMIELTLTHTGGAGVAVPAGTRFQILVEEV